ncbi:hypothetical protein TNCV_3275131 [Trichonephila clavipes]|nr:hypothetical protein TNCV_3275131 [Trichonephila clavipes]
MGFSRQTLGSSYLTTVTIRELRLALQDEWAAMPQQLIETFILSMGRCCETCLTVSIHFWVGTGSHGALVVKVLVANVPSV